MAQQSIPPIVTMPAQRQAWLTSAQSTTAIGQSYVLPAAGPTQPEYALQQRSVAVIPAVDTLPTPIESYAIPDFLDPKRDPGHENECFLSIAIRQSCSDPENDDENVSNIKLTHDFIPRLNRLVAEKKVKGPRWNQQLKTWVNQPDFQGFTPLMYAAHYGVLQAIEPLIKAGATPLREMGTTALHEALYHEKRYTDVTQYNVLKKLLETLHQTNGDSLDDIVNKYSVNLPKDKEGKISSGVYLLQRNGNPVLHDVVDNECISVEETQRLVRLLLHFGANPLLKNDKDETAIDLACSLEDLNKTTILQDLINAVPTGDLDQIMLNPKSHVMGHIHTIRNIILTRKMQPLPAFESQPNAGGFPPPSATVQSQQTKELAQPSSSDSGMAGIGLSQHDPYEPISPDIICGVPERSAMTSRPTPSYSPYSPKAQASADHSSLPLFVLEQAQQEAQETLPQHRYSPVSSSLQETLLSSASYFPSDTKASTFYPEIDLVDLISSVPTLESSRHSEIWPGEELFPLEPAPLPSSTRGAKSRQPTHTISKAPESDTETEPESQATQVKTEQALSEQTTLSLQTQKYPMRLAQKRSLSDQGECQTLSPALQHSQLSITESVELEFDGTRIVSIEEIDSEDESMPLTAKRKRYQKNNPTLETETPLAPTPRKGIYLLEFIIEELQKDEVIHWAKTMEPGIFIIGKNVHEEIAKRWGDKKERNAGTKMTYGNFSRALRNHYKDNIIQHLTTLPSDKKYDFKSPYYKIDINHEKVKPYLAKYNVNFTKVT